VDRTANWCAVSCSLQADGWVLVVFGPEAVFFFSGKSSPNFNLKNYDFDKGFFMEKMVQIRQIVPNCQKNYDNFQQVAKKIEGFWFFSYFHI
jgi:hypothetical protein